MKCGRRTLGSSIDRGLNLVPREGPPTCGSEQTWTALEAANIYQNNSLGAAAGARLGPGGEGGGLQTHGGDWACMGWIWASMESEGEATGAKGGCGRNCESGEFVDPGLGPRWR